MIDPTVKMITESFIKVMANQSLIMLALSTITENEEVRETLHKQAMKIINENNEAIEYLRNMDNVQ